MYVKPFLLAAGLLAVAGCAGNITVPPPGLEHPANPRAVAAPHRPPTIPVVENDPAAMDGMQGMDHGSMQGMNGMDHGSMKNAPGMKGIKKKHMDKMEGMHHAH